MMLVGVRQPLNTQSYTMTMQPSAQASGVLDEVYRKLGRNVVAFQKLEKLLKTLAFPTNIEGPVADLPRIIAKRRKSIDKMSMGKLADEFHNGVFDKQDPLDREVLDPTKHCVSFGFRQEFDCKIEEAEKRALKSLVTERNRLIHRELECLDLNCDESCRALVVKLDEQYVRIERQLHDYHAHWEVQKKASLLLVEFINSDEGRAALGTGCINATSLVDAAIGIPPSPHTDL